MADHTTITWVQVGGDCNCRCEACPFERRPSQTADEVRARAEAERPALLMLRGPGEPTLHAELAELVHAARRGGAADVALVTNGRTLAYARHAARVAGLRLAAVAVTLRHPEAEVHDRLVQVEGAQAQSLAGLRNLARLAGSGTDLLVRAVAHPSLRGQLQQLWQRARAEGARGLWLDGDDEVLQAEARLLGAAGHPVVTDAELPGWLLRDHDPARARQGWAPARFHDDEGAVSLVIRTGCRNGCTFCTTRIVQERGRAPWPLDDLAVFEPALAEGRGRGADRLRLVAVEPLEHPDLPRLLQVAQEQGYRHIEAWTSGRALADPGHAAALADAGLTAVDIPLMGSTAEVHDAVARAPGSFDETVRGVAEAVDRFEARCHLILERHNLHDLGGMLALADSLGLPPPASVLIPAPSTADPGPYEAFAPRWRDVARAVAALPAEARDLLLQRGLAHQVPPCVLERTEGLDPAAMRALPRPPGVRVREGDLDQPGAAAKLPAPCPRRDECAAADRCPGLHELYRQVFGDDEFVPLPDDRGPRARPDDDERFLSGGAAEIKLTAACDQRCVFCKSPRNLANHADPGEVAALLPRLARRVPFLTLSGGETTLAPGLEDTVRAARAAGFERVEIQTNGMALDDRERVRRLADAGLTNVLISLHAHEATLSDRLTGTPGGFQRTLAGIDHALDAELLVSLCHVICAGNHEHLVRYARFVTERWAGRDLGVVFTLAIPTYRVRDDPGLMPPLSEVTPELRAALRRFAPARLASRPEGPLQTAADWVRHATRPLGERGRRWAERAEQLATPPQAGPRHHAAVIAHCGIPMCALGDAAPYHDEWWRAEAVAAQAEMVHPPACGGCALRPRCSGLWQVYVDRFGDDGIAPVPPGDPVGDPENPC